MQEEDGAAVDLDSQRKGKCVVIKTSTRQTIFLPVVVRGCFAGSRQISAVMKCLQGLRRSLLRPQAYIVRLTAIQTPAVTISGSVADFQSAQRTLK